MLPPGAKLMVPDPRTHRSAIELLDLHARTLFTRDAAGRLLAINEPHGKRAPRCFLAWTSTGAICRVRDDIPPALAHRLEAIVAGEPPSDAVRRLPSCLPAVRGALAEHAPVDDSQGGGPAYHFPEVPEVPEVIDERPGVVAITADNAHVLQTWLPSWLPDVSNQLPLLAVIVEGAAVAICGCARLPGEASEAGVETHPAFRGRGHAATVTAAWARAMRARGVTPLYSTSWDNLASQRVAAKLGLIHYGASLGLD